MSCEHADTACDSIPCVNCKYNDGEYSYYVAKKELVHHPAHYTYSEYEPKDVIRGWGLNFNLGSAVKYIARAGRKDDILQELNKAKEFIEFEIEAIEKERKG